MKCKHLIVITVAVLSVAAVAYLVIRHFDDVMRPVHALLKKLGVQKSFGCDCCDDEIFEINAE
jgi:predicted lysophospholipase L1 biosynthesis ABC-type transport system permease subunit